MMEIEWFKQAADIGYPFAILLVIAYGGRKAWSDGWPWFRDVYWPTREARWNALHQAQVARDEQYKVLTEDYLETIRRYENGNRSKSADEHQAIIREIRSMGNTFAELFQGTMKEINSWRKDTLHLMTISEQRVEATEGLLERIEEAFLNNSKEAGSREN